jgi:two-component system, response regulator FlrC
MSAPSGEQPRVQVLLVDDSPVERLALGHFLRNVGYAVDEAGDGASAIAQLQNREIGAVLLDLHMPGTDGFAVLKYIQEHRRSLPVVLLSGMPLHQIQHKMHVLPTHELPPLLIKPIDPEQLLGLLELQLSGILPCQEVAEEKSEDQAPSGKDVQSLN